MKTGRLLGLFLAGAVMLTGCADRGAQENVIMELQDSVLNEPQRTEVVRDNLRVTVISDAQVGPRIEQLQFPEYGTFGEMHVQLGDTVKEGDVLASPALKNIEEDIENKKRELEELTLNYNYRKATLENNIAIAQLELDNVYNELKVLEYGTWEYTDMCIQAGNYDEQRKRLELQLQQLQETYELELPHCEKQLKDLQKELTGNRILAPFDGTVIAIAEAEYGDAIDNKKYYVAVADTTMEYARCELISATTLNRMEKAVFWKDGKEYETTPIPLDHNYYMETKNQGEQAYSQFWITDPEGEISFGDYGKIILVMEEKKNVLCLPETAVLSSGGNYYVYKDVNGEHQRVNVVIGSGDGIRVEVVEGLEEGDVVYVQE